MKKIKLLILAVFAFFTIALNGQNAVELTLKGAEYLENSNYDEAYQCFKQAADQGYAPAQYCLGGCYDYGWGVTQDYQKALEWYKKAVDQGFEEAQERIDEINEILQEEDEDVYETPEIDDDIVEEEIFTIVEEMPEFPGGTEAMLSFIDKNKRYPQEARDAGVSGRVFVGFVVEKDGSFSNISVLRGLGHGCDEEAVRVIESMPTWEPGKQRGNPVRVQYIIKIEFK